jgi:DNA-binding transcriptional regulator YhcF (GntR family)
MSSDAPDTDLTDALVAELKLDPTSSSHLYLQVRNGLARMIRERRFSVDDALPSERVLAERLGISRVTARKAIGALVDEGLIVRRHGSGNYIAPMLEQSLTRLTSFTEELKQRGFEPHSRWIRRIVGPAMPEEMVALGLSPGTRVARLSACASPTRRRWPTKPARCPSPWCPTRKASRIRSTTTCSNATRCRYAPAAHPRRQRQLAPGRTARHPARAGAALHHPRRLPRGRARCRDIAHLVPQRLLRLRRRAAALSVQCFIAPLSILCDAGIVICSLRTVASTSEVLPSSKLMLMGTRSPSFSSLFISISMM